MIVRCSSIGFSDYDNIAEYGGSQDAANDKRN